MSANYTIAGAYNTRVFCEIRAKKANWIMASTANKAAETSSNSSIAVSFQCVPLVEIERSKICEHSNSKNQSSNAIAQFSPFAILLKIDRE